MENRTGCGVAGIAVWSRITIRAIRRRDDRAGCDWRQFGQLERVGDLGHGCGLNIWNALQVLLEERGGFGTVAAAGVERRADRGYCADEVIRGTSTNHEDQCAAQLGSLLGAWGMGG